VSESLRQISTLIRVNIGT